jgi:hypothetical protein
MNITGLIPLLKLFVESGLTTKTSTPPSSDRPARPNCGPGKQAIWNEAFEKWDCVVEFD